MTPSFTLPPAPVPPRPQGLARTWPLRTRAGRVLLGLVAIKVLEWCRVPWPDVIVVFTNILLFGYTCWGTLRFGSAIARWFLWRIRTRILVSYVFIGVVPIVLLLILAGLAGMIGLSLFASHTVGTEIRRKADTLRLAARAALPGLPADGTSAAAELGRRLQVVSATHPAFSYVYVRDGRAVVKNGPAPAELPEWIPADGFAGLVADDKQEYLRGVARARDGFLLLQMPVDDKLFSDLESMTLRLIDSGGRMVITDSRLEVKRDRRARAGKQVQLEGVPFVSPIDRYDWKTGQTEFDPLIFTYEPGELLRRLSPGTVNIADRLVQIFGVVGVVFLVFYFVAVLIGLLLARTITKSVHALSRGTERLRRGDFTTPIPVYGKDQLGELAESFNLMARGVQQLLVEQGEKERLAEELRIARQIQMKLLPQGTVGLPGVRISALCLPAAEVGGDYYDLLPLSPTRMGLLVADVSGKGTSAALYMAELKGLVLSLSRIYDSPARLLAEANRILAGTMDSRSFITMTYAVVDVEARTLRYARAGHNPLLHLHAESGRTRVLAPAGLGLGIDRHGRFEEILEESVVPLAEGDVFLFFTDGISEAMNDADELFGEHRLRELMERTEALGSDEIKDTILGEIQQFVGGAAQHDDMTMVILKVDGVRDRRPIDEGVPEGVAV